MRLIETLNVNVLFLKSELVGWGYTTNLMHNFFLTLFLPCLHDISVQT